MEYIQLLTGCLFGGYIQVPIFRPTAWERASFPVCLGVGLGARLTTIIAKTFYTLTFKRHLKAMFKYLKNEQILASCFTYTIRSLCYVYK